MPGDSQVSNTSIFLGVSTTRKKARAQPGESLQRMRIRIMLERPHKYLTVWMIPDGSSPSRFSQRSLSLVSKRVLVPVGTIRIFGILEYSQCLNMF